MIIDLDLDIVERPRSEQQWDLCPHGEAGNLKWGFLCLYAADNRLKLSVTSTGVDEETVSRPTLSDLLNVLATPPTQAIFLNKLGRFEAVKLLDAIDKTRDAADLEPIPRILPLRKEVGWRPKEVFRTTPQPQ